MAPFIIDASISGNGNSNIVFLLLSITHFQPMFPFYTPWKHQKTSGFLMFAGGIEVEDWLG